MTWVHRGFLLGAVVGLLGAKFALAQQSGLPPPLPIEPVGISETLPTPYPDQWFFVFDNSFNHMNDGKLFIFDPAADFVGAQIKGYINLTYNGVFAQSTKRGEIYGAETFHSRGNRGERTDYLTIWDQRTLNTKGEVLLPGRKRYLGNPLRYAIAITNDDKWIALFNANPAQSLTVIDLDARRIIRDVATPGCAMAYPTGKRNISSICVDGRFLTVELDADGGVQQLTRSEKFFDTDTSPVQVQPAMVGNMAYLPSLSDLIYPIDFSGDVPKVHAPWHLTRDAERHEKWIPSGMTIIDSDDQGRIYILMRPHSEPSDYQNSSTEVWVFDAVQQRRLRRIVLQKRGISVAVNKGPTPTLLVTNQDNALEVYDANSGRYIKTIDKFGQDTPVLMLGVNKPN